MRRKASRWATGTVLATLLAAPRSARAQEVADEPSLSLGDSVRGELRGAVELPRRAPGLLRLSSVAGRDTGWGTRALVDLLLRTAAHLQTIPAHADVPLRVGNLSLRRGGEMRWSHSHRSGRDADVLLYLVDEANGMPVLPDAFVALDAQGRAKVGKGRHEQRVRFDAARMWNVVAALLQDGHVQVQHLYLAEPLRKLLLAEARATGAPESLVQRAQRVVTEPAHAGRHDDHLHIRLYCSRADRLAGCSDDGPRWPWVQGFDHEVRRRVDDLLADLGEPEGEVRRTALISLTWMQHADPRATDALVWAAVHETPELREVALAALQKLPEPRAFPGLVQAAREETNPQVVQTLLRAALAVAVPDEAPELLAWLAVDHADVLEPLPPEARSRMRSEVARTVRPWLLEEAAGPLVAMLDDPDVGARRSALRSLECLANRQLGNEDVAVHWYAREGEHGRLRWMVDGFAQRGLPVRATPEVLAPRLIGVLEGKDEGAALNAQAWLQHLLGAGPVEPVETATLRHRAWARWWDLHRSRYRMDEAEPATRPATATTLPDQVPAASSP